MSEPAEIAATLLRCDLLPHAMNAGKERKVRALLRLWREVAAEENAAQRRLFQAGLPFDRSRDEAADHRKATVAVRTGLVSLLAARGERELKQPERKLTTAERTKLKAEGKDVPKRRLAPVAPGFADPLAATKASLGAARVQMVRHQLVAMLESFVSNRRNDFVAAVRGSSLDERTRHMLLSINRREAWFRLDGRLALTVEGADGRKRQVEIPAEIRRLARKIMSATLKRHRWPSTRRIGMVIDRRAATFSGAAHASEFDHWLELATLERRRNKDGSEGTAFETVAVPLRAYRFFEKREGTRKATIQVSEDRETKRLSFGIVTDVTEVFAASRAAYAPLRDVLQLDFGLTTLLADGDGGLHGRGWLRTLKAFDKTIAGIARHRQRSGEKPRTSRRYRAWVAALQGWLKSEIGRILNRLVALKKPAAIVAERLDFRCPGLSKRLNRILRNCGRRVFRDKMRDLAEKFGIAFEEVNPAYTSQACSACGYVDSKNRPDQSAFRCRWCGLNLHADVNAARNIGARRSDPIIGSRWVKRQAVLAELVRRFLERWPDLRACSTGSPRGAPADPRPDNPYFRDWAKARSSAVTGREREKCPRPALALAA